MRDVCLSDRPLTHSACLLAALLPFALSDRASADESGVSFWLQGQFGSFAAAPSNPGWSFESTYYRATAEASPSVSFARGGGIQTGVKSPTDFVMLTPTYVFATPVLGGQAAVGMSALYGRNTTSVSATLTGPGGASLSGSSSDYVLGFGDLYPAASLKWNRDVHNFMVYATTGIPVGVYDPTRLASMGLGHWAADAGAGYTYLNEQIGFEWSAVAGLTYNFINPYKSLHPIPERHRRALGLGDFAVSLRQIPPRRRRLCLQPADGRQRPGRQARRIQITRCGSRAADRFFLSNRGPRRIPQSQSLLRVQRQQPAARMDGVRHVLG